MHPAAIPNQQPNPMQIIDAVFAFGHTQALITATELDLFTHIDEQKCTATALAEVTASDPRAMRILLNALTGLGFLTKNREHYDLTPTARTFLSKRNGLYIGPLVLQAKRMRDNWSALGEVLQSGRPRMQLESTEGGEFFAEFVSALYAINAAAADEIAQRVLQRSATGGLRVLDVGAGSGVWGLAFLRHDPQARLTVADWPVVIEVTKTFVDRDHAADRVNYLAGDYHETDFGENQFDVAILGHICHSEGERQTKELFARLRRALKPDGQILIAEFLADEARRENAMALLFAVNMLVHTEEGDTFTTSELRQWLEEAGFEGVTAIEAPAPSPLIVATKAAAERQQLIAA